MALAANWRTPSSRLGLLASGVYSGTPKGKDGGVLHRIRHNDRPNNWRLIRKDGGIFVYAEVRQPLGKDDVRAILEPNRLFTEFKGALIEQYAAQEIVAATNRRACLTQPLRRP